MYPYQRTPTRNPYISRITRGYLWVISSPRIPRVKHGFGKKKRGAFFFVFFVEVGTYRPRLAAFGTKKRGKIDSQIFPEFAKKMDPLIERN